MTHIDRQPFHVQSHRLAIIVTPPKNNQSGRIAMSSFRLRHAAIALASTCVCAWAAPAGAQLATHKDLTASIAITIVQTAIETCKANGYKVSSTVVGRNGEIIAQVRGDDTGPHTIENSFRKAYTARTFRSPSGALVDRLKADPTLGLIHLNNVIANQGALPIKVGEDVIGAAGASGAPGGEKDEACVKAGIDKVADQLK
jgi:uncharacterized protein GlcG (DUF336 family)